MKKRLTLEELRERRADIDQAILRVRKVFETHKAERDKLYSKENKLETTEFGLQKKETEFRRTAEKSLSPLHATIQEKMYEAGEHREIWSYDHELRTARFAPEGNANALSETAQLKAIFNEVMETFKRGNAENRAHRYTVQDLITETERAALEGDTATLAIFQQEARNRQLKGEEKIYFDKAFRQLSLPEIDEAQTVFKNLEDLQQEANGLFTLWREPGNQMAQTYESLGRFNRRKRAEALVKMVEEAKVSETEALRLQWQQGTQAAAPEPKADTPEAQTKAAEVTKPIPVPMVIEPPSQAA